MKNPVDVTQNGRHTCAAPAAWTLRLLALCLCLQAARACAAEPLWRIGVPDNNNTEYSLAPKGHAQFKDDGFFVVGKSDAKTDWPYVHPGPGDGWAGGRQHTFTILFGLKEIPDTGPCHLILDMLDTHQSSPPRLRVAINGKGFEKNAPKGGGDASVFGEPAKGRDFIWNLEFPSDLLRQGGNEITIATLSGSWMLYDAISLETPSGAELRPVEQGTRLLGVQAPPVWLKSGDKAYQPLSLSVRHVGEDTEAEVRIDDRKLEKVVLKNGLRTLELRAPVARQSRNIIVSILSGAKTLASTNTVLGPPKIQEIWILPHSHVDIGYTDRQDKIVDVQIGNLEKSMELAAASAGNPPGMRFKWNPEAVWSLDHFLKRATPKKREQFIQAVKRGDVGVDGLYGNMLTALCRPEELAQCLAFGARLSNLTGVPVESASICDVPGYTWGIVSMMRQAGVKYFAIGPNFGDRVGTIHLWDNKPFYWKSPSGLERVLCWVVDNYHHFGNMEEHVLAHVAGLGQSAFPYNMSFLFWVGVWPNGGVDNAPPDEQTVEKVKAWNAKYAAPRLVIGLTDEYFRAFEKQNAPKVPEFSGDITPYWEDGAGSTSRETAMNRASGDRLAQADTLFAMINRTTRPGAQFDEAWKNVLLYSEHTWGAWCSISKPDDSFTKDQWSVKQSFALQADKDSRALLNASLTGRATTDAGDVIDVFNTTQWTRTDLATAPSGRVAGGITDEQGKAVPSQRLASGELVFLAADVPPFGSRRFKTSAQPYTSTEGIRASGLELRSKTLTVKLDASSGAVTSLRLAGVDNDFVDSKAPVGLNDYRYMLGTDAKGATANGPVKITVVDNGPLVATVRVESDAPGCSNLVREIRIVAGLDRVEFVDHVNRLPVRQKDGVHFGFGFNVPDAALRMETPWAVVRPNVDQLEGSCRNWFTVQRWVDISNKDFGVSWAPLDAPLMEIGAMTANLLGSVGFNEWMTRANDSQTIYSWAQNNHWHTNYKIDQPGVTTFRFVVRPHRGGYSAAESARFGMETTRPLIASPGESKQPSSVPLFSLSTPEVLVETVKVSDDGKALIVRLFGVSGKPQFARLDWKEVKPSSIWLTDLTEKPLKKAESEISVPAYGVVNVRAEMP